MNLFFYLFPPRFAAPDPVRDHVNNWFASPAPASLFENRTGLFLSSEAGFAGVEGGLDAGLHRVYKTFQRVHKG